jgi:hypothetical protein
MGADEEGTLAQLKAHRRALIDPTEHRGRIVKTTGDGMLVEFASVVDALRCAVEIQRGMIERNDEVSQDRRIEFRMGIHQGDIIIDGGDIFGDGVNVAARLEGLAEPGGICWMPRIPCSATNALAMRSSSSSFHACAIWATAFPCAARCRTADVRWSVRSSSSTRWDRCSSSPAGAWTFARIPISGLQPLPICSTGASVPSDSLTHRYLGIPPIQTRRNLL